MGSNPSRDALASILVLDQATNNKKGNRFDKIPLKCHSQRLPSTVSYQRKEFEVMTLQDALVAYKTYARGIRAFFGCLHRDGFLETNPMEKVKMPKVPETVVPTFSAKEIAKLLAQPNKHSDEGSPHKKRWHTPYFRWYRAPAHWSSAAGPAYLLLLP